MKNLKQMLYEQLGKRGRSKWVRNTTALPIFTEYSCLSEVDKETEILRILLKSMILLESRDGLYTYEELDDCELLCYGRHLANSSEIMNYVKIFGVPEYLSDVFSQRDKFLTKENLPVVMVIACICMEQGVAPDECKVFLNSFNAIVCPKYEAKKKSNKRKNVERRLLFMYDTLLGFFEIPPDGSFPPIWVSNEEVNG